MKKLKTPAIIYCDTAATTPVALPVQKEIIKHLKATFGNAGSIHQIGVMANDVLNNSRGIVADFLKARPQEIIFTSGGTESNNLAIIGIINACLEKGYDTKDLHIITSNIEHSSVRETFLHLEKKGCQVDWLSVEKNGQLSPNVLRKALRPNTVLVSLAYANSEIGVIQPLSDLVKEIRHARKTSSIKISEDGLSFPYTHLDASQATLWLPMNTEKLGVELLTLDGQKIYGPKGVGALYVRSGVVIKSIMFGGKQEIGLRPGTENIPLIAGFAKALTLVPAFQKTEPERILAVRNYFVKKISQKIPEAIINGGLENRLPNNINFSLIDSDSEYLLLQLAENGIICSAKSACLAGDAGSYVVGAIADNPAAARSSLRFTFGAGVGKKEVDKIIDVLSKNVFRGGLI